MKLKILSIIFIISVLTLTCFDGFCQEKSTIGPVEPATDESGFFEDYFKGYYSQVFGIKVTDIINLSLYSTIEKWIEWKTFLIGETAFDYVLKPFTLPMTVVQVTSIVMGCVLRGILSGLREHERLELLADQLRERGFDRFLLRCN